LNKFTEHTFQINFLVVLKGFFVNQLAKWNLFARVKLSILLALILLATTPVTTTHAAVGFHISGRNLLDANSNNFIMRGINHPHVWYPGQTASFANIKAAGANTIRVVLGGGRWGPSSASDVSNIITLCKTNKLICVLEDHDTTGYGEDSAATSLATAVNYWKSIQSVLTGQEAYVIINIGNEPYGNTNYGNWVNDTKNAIIAMRNAGFQHTLMVDAPNWGQDWSFTMRDNAASVFASDNARNTIFSVHMYGVYDTAAEIQSYIGAFVNAGLPLVIGEFGFNHSDGNPDEDTIMSEAQARGIGYMGWSWSGNGGGVEYLDLVTNFDPNQRTSWGTRLIAGANGLQQTAVQCSVYNGTNNPTNTPTRTNTPTNTPSTPLPTATRTNTPTATVATFQPPSGTPTATSVTSGALKVQLQRDGIDNAQESHFVFRVVNTGNSAQSNISVRFYIQLDNNQPISKYVFEKYWDQSGSATVSAPVLVSGNVYYFAVSYGGATLAAGGSWQFNGALHLNDWTQNFSASNDAWHAPYAVGTLPSTFTDTARIPAYIGTTLVWGTTP
jgi:mannan endo-1,4-beta-mannosidase